MIDANAVIKDFKEAVAGLYGDRLDKIILYGSRARGDNREDSDFDFAVVLKDEKVDIFGEIDFMSSAVYDLILKYDIDISYHPATLAKLQAKDKLLYYFIRKEGKVI